MATDLQDELRRLADDVPVAVPPRDLWIRGVRRRRRRRATALAIAAAVALIFSATGVVSFDASRRLLEPTAPAPRRAAIPTRVDTPSPWTPATGSTPIGPLAVIGEAPHHHNWFTKPDDVFGVSARTGTYRFLDLPGLAGEQGGAPRATLSPDGRHVGYWIEGAPPEPPLGFEGTPVVGFASYDTVTGAVTTHHVPTVHGVEPQAMLWVSRSELLVDYGRLTKRSGLSLGYRSYLWNPVRRTLRQVPGSAADDLNDLARTPSGFSSTSGRWLDVWNVSTLAHRHYRVPVDIEKALVSPTGKSVALKGGDSEMALYAGRLIAAGPVPVHRSADPDGGLLEVLAWIDKRHIVGPLLVRGHAAAAVVSVDVRTGARKTVGFGAHSYGEYATDLWSRPLAHGPGAPREVNPWWATFVVGSAGYFAVLIFWNLRRRRNDTA